MWSREGVFMKNKTNKLRNLERNRYSVFYDDLDVCCNCGSTYRLTKHELFSGRNRRNSMIYGFVLPLCERCHQMLQEDYSFNMKWKKKSQEYFEENYGTREDFLSIFRMNYLD